MKTKLLFLSALMLLAVVGSFAQITTTGMAIQGIARNANNTAITNATIGLKFTVYYGLTPVVSVYEVSPQVTTDAFGVFSYTLDLLNIENNVIYDNQLFLKIEQISPGTGVTISNEKLNFVPYAISARNGVPTGSIMPFIGTTAPKGWVLCEGQLLTSITPLPSVLIAMIGNNAPDLRGMFLRGAGGSLTHVGPALKAVQEDSLESHLHPVNIDTDTKGLHKHGTTFYNDDFNGSGGSAPSGLTKDSNINGNNNTTINTSETGDHKHNVSGNTLNTGAVETRPVNYGVNYIIKL
jgi:Phage Tail Collar Domain